MKYKIKQTWGFGFLVLLAVIYLMVFIWGTGNAEEPVTEIYFADRITAAHEILIDRYNKLNEGKVKVVAIDFPHYDFSTDERKEVLARALRGRGDGIDLFAVDLIWVQRFARWCEPVSKYFTKKEQARFLDIALESCYYEGELVSIPLDLVQGVMYYREDLLKKYVKSQELINQINNGITWEQFIELNRNIDTENPKYIFPASDFEGFICSFTELVMSQNHDYFKMSGFNLNNREAKRALQLIVDLIHKYSITPNAVTTLTDVPSYEYFIKNDGLFIHGWNSYDKDFKHVHFDKEKEAALKKVPLPYFEDGEPASVLGGWNLMVSKFSNKKEAVIDFVKFLLSNESQEIFYRESGYYPVIKEFYENEEYIMRYPEIPEIKEYMNAAVHRPAHVEYTKYSQIMSQHFKQALKKELTVEQALEYATLAINYDKNIIVEE